MQVTAEAKNSPPPAKIIMLIKVNGQDRDLPEGETVRALVVRYNLTPEKVAVELNRRLLRTEKYDTVLKNGDEVEIVTFVGGG
ncbi:MAG: sulfur carrier protein ThiS [Phycisphaerales bacterium]|nr:sulfur carrier protein ThiS [Phycisphaerales bacterium]